MCVPTNEQIERQNQCTYVQHYKVHSGMAGAVVIGNSLKKDKQERRSRANKIK